MSPWVVLAAFVAAINLAAFLAVRGRWGRIVAILALASVAGTVAGDAVGSAIRLDLLRLGDFHLLSASAGAQLAMLVTVLVAAMLPDGTGRGEEQPQR